METQLAKPGEKAVSPAKSFRNMLQGVAPKLEAVLPKYITPQRFIEIAISTITKNPRILKCDALTVVRACIEASQLGLVVDGVLGHAYIVPYGNVAQLQVGYRGYTHMAMETGEIKEIYADVVRAGDLFEYEYGLNKYLRHKPCDDDSPITHAYAYAQFVNGGSVFTVMNRKKIDGIRSRSKASDNGPWVTDYDQMAKKTAIRNLCIRYLPLSTGRGEDMIRAAVTDEQHDLGIVQDVELPEQGSMEAATAHKTEEMKQAFTDTTATVEPSTYAPPPQESAGVIEAVTAGPADNSKPGKVQIGTKEYTTFDKKLIVLASSLHRKTVNFNYRVVEKAGRQYFNLVSIEAQ